MRKVANDNDRTKFDQPESSLIKKEEGLAKLPPDLNLHYLTNAQVKDANWLMKELFRLNEFDRLRLANQKDAKENILIERKKAREEAVTALAATSKSCKT
jgi:hypothetical protein